MAMAPPTTSARPAVTIREGEVLDNPATKANGTVRPSERPKIISRTISLDVKCDSWWRFEDFKGDISDASMMCVCVCVCVCALRERQRA